MANTINLISKYVPLLDEVYKRGLLTGDLEGNQALVRESMNANELLIPKISVQGLADYDKSSGFVSGNANLTWETHTFTQDRGREFNIDNADNMETAGVAFGALAADFVSTKVVPETDAYRFAELFDNSGATAEADLTASTIDAAIDTAVETMDEANVPDEGRILYVSPTAYKLVKQSDNFSRDLAPGQSPNRNFGMYDNMRVVKVPQSRFYSAITLYDGSTSGEEAGGYIRYGSQYDGWAASTAYAIGDIIEVDGNVYTVTADGTSGTTAPTFTQDGADISDGTVTWVYTADSGREINFQIVHPTAVLPIVKINTPRVFEPSVNQDADAYKYQLRLYHDCFVFDNKVDGIYTHIATGE